MFEDLPRYKDLEITFQFRRVVSIFLRILRILVVCSKTVPAIRNKSRTCVHSLVLFLCAFRAYCTLDCTQNQRFLRAAAWMLVLLMPIP
jgi:hypothetical protein